MASPKLLPFNQLPPEMGTLALPDYVPTERIGVNLPLLSKIAGLACCKPLVKLDMYTGSTTQYDPGIAGMMDDGTAAFGINAKHDKNEAKLATHAFSQYDPTNNTKDLLIDANILHQRPQFHIQYNLAEIDNRLSLANAQRRDVRPWVRLLNQGARTAISAASKEHLLRPGRKTKAELADGALLLGAILAVHYVGSELELFDVDYFSALLPIIFFQNIEKAREAKAKGDFQGACFSLIPGYHLDRLLLTRTLSKARRIFRVLPPGTLNPPDEATGSV